MVKRTTTFALLLALSAAVATAADSPRIAVVDMERVIKTHPRTQADRNTLEQYVADYDEERDEQVARMRKLTEEFERLRTEAADSALSERAREQKQEQARIKLEELREQDRVIRETASVRQRELTSQELRMRNRVVADIKRAIAVIAREQDLGFVLSADDSAATAFPAVLYYPEASDITDKVIQAISAERSAEQ